MTGSALVLLAVLACAAAAPPSRSGGEESLDEKAVEKQILELGGNLTRDQKAPGKPVVGVDLRSAEVDARLLRSLAVFPELTTLHLWYTTVDDDALAALAGLKKLSTLDLHATKVKVTDAGLKHLARLKGLQR